MTPAEAARQVASLAESRYYDTDDEIARDVQSSLARAFEEFAELLDRTPVVAVHTFSSADPVRYISIPALTPCGPRCPDGIACPLADDYPGAH